MKIISFFNLILVTATSFAFNAIMPGYFVDTTTADLITGSRGNSGHSGSSRSDRDFQRRVKSSQKEKANAEKARQQILKSQEAELKAKQKKMEKESTIAQKNRAKGMKQAQEKNFHFTKTSPEKADSSNAKKELLKKAAKTVVEDVIVMEAKKIEARKATSK
jgi:hypothetical protein